MLKFSIFILYSDCNPKTILYTGCRNVNESPPNIKHGFKHKTRNSVYLTIELIKFYS